MKTKFRAVVLIAALGLLAGVLGARDATSFPSPDRRAAFQVAWRDGANYLQVKMAGKHYAIVTLSDARVIDSRRVTVRNNRGDLLRENLVILMADEVGMAEAMEKPSPEWWDMVLEIKRGAPQENLLPPPSFPSAEMKGNF